MTQLIVTLHAPIPPGTIDLELPGDVPLRDLLPELLRALGLAPSDEDGQSIPYGLVHQRHRRSLGEAETLLGAGVLTGDELLLITVAGHVQASERAAGARAGPAALLESAAEMMAAPDEWRERAPLAKIRPLVTSREAPASAPLPLGLDRHPGAHTPSDRCGVASDPGRKVVALWSGPAGGTGRTTLAFTLAAWAAEQREDVALLALSEPALSAYLRLPRVPNVAAFFESGDLGKAEQPITWEGSLTSPRAERGRDPTRGEQTRGMKVILGPARPGGGVMKRERIGGLVEAACEAYGLVVLDLPPLTPGGNPWLFEPLARATDVLLVAVPTSAGVVAVVEALATLRDLAAAASAYLALNRRAPGGVSARAFAEGVAQLWGTCPALATEVDFLPELPDRLYQGNVTGQEKLCRALRDLAAACLDAPRP